MYKKAFTPTPFKTRLSMYFSFVKTMPRKVWGFTLIELLIVIAIIGILSSVTLASLNKARDKAQDAKIKAQLSQLKSESELFYDNNGHYGAEGDSCLTEDSFFVNSNPANLISNSELISGGTAICVSDNDIEDVGNATSWAVSIPLKSDPLISWCVDSMGNSLAGTAEISVDNQAVCN